MPNTSVYFPEGLLSELDRLAAQQGVSRNGLIVESCRKALSLRREWPEGFFSNNDLSARELSELRRGGAELESAIAGSRRTRESSPF
jgi:hypothetical protein